MPMSGPELAAPHIMGGAGHHDGRHHRAHGTAGANIAVGAAVYMGTTSFDTAECSTLAGTHPPCALEDDEDEDPFTCV
jgi:hypothetical protein